MNALIGYLLVTPPILCSLSAAEAGKVVPLSTPIPIRVQKEATKANTALDAYMKEVKAAIASRWYVHMKDGRRHYKMGSTKVAFLISKEGKISGAHIVENTSNDEYALMCVKAVMEAQISKPPTTVIEEMKDGRMAHDFTFNYLTGPPR